MAPKTILERTVSKSLVFGGLALLVVGLAASFAFGQPVEWVGHIDLEVRFVASDAITREVQCGEPFANDIGADPIAK